jgi:hypothetical protein
MGRIEDPVTSEIGQRYILFMDIYDGCICLGMNEHYTLDTPLLEAIKDFLQCCKEYDGGKYNIDTARGSNLKVMVVGIKIADWKVFIDKEI